MTIKEFCKKCNGCGSCVFFPICVWNDKKPLKWDNPTSTVITNAIIETARRLEQDQRIADIKSDIDKLTRYQLTDKTQTISKKAVDRVFNLHLYGSRDANGKKDSNDYRSE